MRFREAFFAGSWYPGSETSCRAQMDVFFQETSSLAPGGVEAIGGIVPHAGWTYSGRLAGAVFSLLRHGTPPHTVVLFGGHLGPRSRHGIMTHGGWETPLGPIEVDGELARALTDAFPMDAQDPETVEPDNTLELQLPFVRYAFPEARILPVTPAPTEEGIQIGVKCAQAARALGRRVRVVGSTDLTHYGAGYGFMPKGSGREAEQWVRDVNDPRLIQFLVDMQPQAVVREGLSQLNACCPGAAACAVACMRELGARVAQKVGYATSRDVHPSDEFVGYVGLAFWA